MNKVLSMFFVLGVMVALSAYTMIYGWGLEPKSWWIIIGVGVFGQGFMKMIGDKAMKSDE